VLASSLMAAPRASGPALRWSSCATLVVYLFLASRVSAQTQAPDRWWARDKAIHYSVSLMLAADGYAVASAYTDRPAWRALWGAAFSLSAGLAKEFYDESRGRYVSGRDLAWDALGTATGTTVAWLIDRCFFENPRRTQ
jgi:putative lipoprotein